MGDESQFGEHVPSIAEVESIIDRLRPALVADGGNVEVLGVETDGTVRLVLQGECATCPAQQATLRVGLEEPLKRTFAGIKDVVAV